MTRASGKTEPLTAMLMEEVVRSENVRTALKRVRANKGGPGIDGMTVEETVGLPHETLATDTGRIATRRHIPSPVKRVTIPKPGGTRELGIPIALDRCIQQAILQVLTPILDPTFSPHSYGFRPGKNAHQAVEQAKSSLRKAMSGLQTLIWKNFSTG